MLTNDDIRWSREGWRHGRKSRDRQKEAKRIGILSRILAIKDFGR